jgi:flagella basal body P-ring formation protein FlgA
MIAAFILACCLAAPAEVTVDSETLALGALIPFPGGDARATIVLGHAPQPGSARKFMKYELLNKITAAGLPTDDLNLPESVMVRRKSQYLDADAVRETVQTAFANLYPNAAVNVLSVDVPPTVVGGGEMNLKATIPPRPDISKKVFVKVDIRGAGFSRSIFVPTVAEIQIPQLVLKAPVTANSPIRPEDLDWQAMPVRSIAGITSLENLEGKVAKHDLSAGQVLTADLLYAPLLVRRGDVVTVKAASGGIAISAAMRAKTDARMGDTILVEHLSGTGSASARVIGTRTLQALQGAK